MTPILGTTSSGYAAALAGMQDAQRRVANVAQRVGAPGAMAPVDSAEFSDAARAASADDMAGDAVELSRAKTQMAAMALLVKTQEKMDRTALDLMG